MAYCLEGKIYINLTNLCTNDCIFCIRSLKDDVEGKNLFLKSEKFEAKDVIKQIEALLKEKQDVPEIVFCGYGEPTMKFDILKEVASYLIDKYKNIKIRLNTNGHGSLFNKKDITKEMKGLIDSVSVSLNAENADLYGKLSKPKFDFKKAYNEVLEFTKACVNNGIDTTMSIVSGYPEYEVDIKKCEEIATNLGAKFRVREWLPKGY